MIERVFSSANLEKMLKGLRRSGQEGEMAAFQCSWLIKQICQGRLMSAEVFNKRTKHGEYRLKNCVKYDLGNGYRLITVRSGDDLFIPFVGKHDEVDKWLDRRKQEKYLPDDSNYLLEKVEVADEYTPITSAGNRESRKLDIYEQELRQRLDDAMLKEIFSSLYQKQHESAGE